MQWNLKDMIARRVVDYYIDNPPVYEQIVHTQAVASYTRLIAVGEEPDAHRVDLLEVAAWLHDIGCPEARRLYGDSRPMHQQETGCRMAAEWLEAVDGLTTEEKSWLAAVVGSHHQLPAARKLHFEPLFEADLIVNLIEGYYDKAKAGEYLDKMVTTATGKALYRRLFGL